MVDAGCVFFFFAYDSGEARFDLPSTEGKDGTYVSLENCPAGRRTVTVVYYTVTHADFWVGFFLMFSVSSDLFFFLIKIATDHLVVESEANCGGFLGRAG